MKTDQLESESMPKKPAATFDRAAYDAKRTDDRSGKHRKPQVVFRPEGDELADITRAAKAEGVTRNDWIRAACLEKLDRDAEAPKEIDAPSKKKKR